MKRIRMSLISWQGVIVNEWSVPYSSRRDGLTHALDRAEQEGRAGVLWAVVNHGKVSEIAFDSHNPRGIEVFARVVLPYMSPKGLDVDRLLSASGQPKGVKEKEDTELDAAILMECEICGQIVDEKSIGRWSGKRVCKSCISELSQDVSSTYPLSDSKAPNTHHSRSC